MEELLVRGACGCAQRPQESQVRVQTEGVEFMLMEMVGAVERL